MQGKPKKKTEKAKTPKSQKKKSIIPSKEKKLLKTIEEIKIQCENLSSERDKLNEKNIRLLAEFDNYKRRTTQEKSNIIKHAVADFAQELITIIDDLERTLESVKDGQKTDPFVNGVNLVHDKFQKILNDHGIHSFHSVGEKFDPDLHDALTSQEAEDTEDDIILTEFQKGYRYHNKVIRHAKVIVCKNKVKA